MPSARGHVELLTHPVGVLVRSMLFFGPLSSVFDFIPFGVMLWVFRSGSERFRTGCQGVNGGGRVHYVGQEKARPLTGYTQLANALDRSRRRGTVRLDLVHGRVQHRAGALLEPGRIDHGTRRATAVGQGVEVPGPDGPYGGSTRGGRRASGRTCEAGPGLR